MTDTTDNDKEQQPSQPEKRPASRIRRIFPYILLTLLFASIWVVNVSIGEESKRLAERKAAEVRQERPPVNVVVQEIVPTHLKDRLMLPGMVEPWVHLDLKSLIHGAVVEIPVQEGKTVAEGEVIARVDDRDYRIAVEAARANLGLAQANLDRARDLCSRNLMSKADLDRAEAEAANLGAVVRNAELSLERTVITAPMAGVINKLDAKVGLLLNVGDPVAEILRIDRVKAVVAIPEADVTAVRERSVFDLEIKALEGGKKIRGEKVFLSSAPDPAARTYRLEIALENASQKILPGMFVTAEIVRAESGKALSIPLYSVVARRDEKIVMVEEGGKAKIRPITLGFLDGFQIQVASGLSPGDRVIVVGQRSVEDGQAVQVVKTVTSPSEILE